MTKRVKSVAKWEKFKEPPDGSPANLGSNVQTESFFGFFKSCDDELPAK